MSGGYFNYQEYMTASEFCGQWEDLEINALFDDLFSSEDGCINLVHTLDYYKSGDTCEETYREAVKKFKKKWLGRTMKERAEFYQEKLQGYCDELKKEFGNV